MFEQDYIMRLIKEMVRAILKMLFGIDTESCSVDMLESKEDQEIMTDLMDMLDEGRICEAENRIYMLTEDGSKQNLFLAILFYSYLNDKTDEFLTEHNFSREEVKTGLQDVMSAYGLGNLSEMFLE